MTVAQAPIEDYALLGDLQTAALVDRTGTVAWLCLPRFDSPACFAALLGGPEAGGWQLCPAEDEVRTTRRRYRPDTMILESEWEVPGGVVRVVDFMPPRGSNPDVVRLVQGVRGTVRMRCDLAVRFDYGHVVPWVRRREGRWFAIAGPDALWLDTPVHLRGEDRHSVAEFDVHAGETVPFVLTWSASYEGRPQPVDPLTALEETEQFWRDWIGRCTYTGRYADQVRRSLLTLKALTYAPTGGIAAAATTSLPEEIGGSRNWDYRFCWLRDAAFSLQALAGAGFVEEAGAWRDWLLRAVAGDPADLRVMYSLTGRRRLPEQELDWLAGYEGSRPVRIGNAAAHQFQLDVYGRSSTGSTPHGRPGCPATTTPGPCRRT